MSYLFQELFFFFYERKEKRDLLYSRTFQPQGVKHKKQKKKHENLSFKLLLQKI